MSNLRRIAGHVGVVFLATFVGSILTAQADWTHLSTDRSAAVAAVSAALGAILSSLQPAAATASSAVGATVTRARAASSVRRSRRVDVAEPIRRARIVVVNQCQTSPVTNAQVRGWVTAVSAQAHDFAHDWGLAAPTVTFATHPPASNIDTVIVLCDNADQAGALGYHSETVDGVTYGRVFAADCLAAGVTISSCLSHEVLEALADLNVDRWVDGTDGREWALEVCDPVESDSYTDDAGVELSSYVLPSFFNDAGSAPFDRLGRLIAPFSLSAGGYAVVRTAGQPQQVFGDRASYDAREGWRHATKASPLSRTSHRLVVQPSVTV